MPLAKNDIIPNVEITDIGEGGVGIGHADGLALFVRHALPGDIVTARITKVKKTYAYARIESLDTPSPHRVPSFCAVSGRCGGCQLTELSYEAELDFKHKKVRDSLARIGGFPESVLSEAELPILPSPETLHYRNKAQYPVAIREGHILSGFYAPHSHTVIPTGECSLVPPLFADILQCILQFLEEEGISVYDENTGSGLVRHILIRQARASGEIQVLPVINGKSLPGAEELIGRLKAFPGFTSLSVSVNKEQSNVILGKTCKTLYGPDKITDTLTLADTALRFQISPLSFYQVNSLQTGRLYETALSFAGLTGSETVWDLYCGIGTISLFLAKQAATVTGIEENPAAVRDARENAALNRISNTEFFAGKAEEVLLDKKLPAPDVIMVDPPRAGLMEQVTAALTKVSPKRIVYVSCNPATLARDVKALCDGGYELKRFRPVDMFPRTTHVETVCLLSKLSEAKNHISVKVDMDEMDLTAAESKATYQEIKEWVKEKYGFHVSHLNIAKTKRKCGIIERKNYNLPKNEDSRSPETPKEKEEAITEAFRHFQMI